MIGTIIAVGVAYVAGSVSTYFFLRNNRQKAAVINKTVSTIGTTAGQLAGVISQAAK